MSEYFTIKKKIVCNCRDTFLIRKIPRIYREDFAKIERLELRGGGVLPQTCEARVY